VAQGAWSEALRSAERAGELAPSWPLGWIASGCLLLRAGEAGRARAHLERAAAAAGDGGSSSDEGVDGGDNSGGGGVGGGGGAGEVGPWQPTLLGDGGARGRAARRAARWAAAEALAAARAAAEGDKRGRGGDGEDRGDWDRAGEREREDQTRRAGRRKRDRDWGRGGTVDERGGRRHRNPS